MVWELIGKGWPGRRDLKRTTLCSSSGRVVNSAHYCLVPSVALNRLKDVVYCVSGNLPNIADYGPNLSRVHTKVPTV